MSEPEWPYTLVAPALLLQDEAGSRASAHVTFDPPMPLGDMFAIEFWLRPLEVPRANVVPSYNARLLTASLRLPNGLMRDFHLRIDDRHFTPEFQDFHGPIAPTPPRDCWTHVQVSFTSGTLRLILWREGGVVYDRREGLSSEIYQIASLTLTAEQGAAMLVAEVRLWTRPRDDEAIAEQRGRPVDPAVSAGLVGYWKLDETTGSSMIDAVTPGHDGDVLAGTCRLDSGLALRVAAVQGFGAQRQDYGDGRLRPDGGRQAHWKGEAPESLLAPPLDAIERRMRQAHYAATMTLDADRRRLEARLPDLHEALIRVQEDAALRQAALDEALRQSAKAVSAQRGEWERRRRETLDPIWASPKIDLKDFIVQLQADLSRGRDRIRREHGRVVGLDAVSMDVKVIPGVGGVGLLLPDPAAPVDPGRLSTVRLRFRAVPPEDEDERTWAVVPALEGATEEFGRRKLERAGFRVSAVYQEVDDEAQDGRILAQLHDRRAADGLTRHASLVTLVVGQRR